MELIDFIGEEELIKLRESCENFVYHKYPNPEESDLFDYYKEINQLFGFVFVPIINNKDDDLGVKYTINPLYKDNDFEKEEVVRINYILQALNYYIGIKLQENINKTCRKEGYNDN